MSTSVNDYITRLEQQLQQRGIHDTRLLAEAREHLLDAIEDGRRGGLTSEEAESKALEQFGSPEIVAAHVLEERGQHGSAGIAGACATIWRHKWWMFAPTIIAAVIAGVASDFQPLRYRSEMTILVVPQRVPENYVRSSVTTRIEDRLRTINQQVTSRTRLERIINDFNLYPERRKKDRMQDIVDDMSRAIEVEIVHSDVFRVAFTSDNPRTAQQVTERLATFFIDEAVKDRTVLADGAREFLETQVADAARMLRETEQKIAEYKKVHGGELPNETNANLQRDTELTELMRDYNTLRSQYDDLFRQRLDAQVAANLERQLGEQFRILDPARLPEQPVASSRLRTALMGALVGLAAGLVLVVFRRSSNTNTRPPALAQA